MHAVALCQCCVLHFLAASTQNVLTSKHSAQGRHEDADQPGSARGYPDQPGSARGYPRDAHHPDSRRRDYNARFHPQRYNQYNPRDEPHWRAPNRNPPSTLNPREPEPREGFRRGEAGPQPSDPQDIPSNRGPARQLEVFHSGSVGTDTDRSVPEGLARSPGNLSPGERSWQHVSVWCKQIPFFHSLQVWGFLLYHVLSIEQQHVTLAVL